MYLYGRTSAVYRMSHDADVYMCLANAARQKSQTTIKFIAVQSTVKSRSQGQIIDTSGRQTN